MLRLKPDPQNVFTCPECGSPGPLIREFKFGSVDVLADCVCAHCQFEFYQVLPAGHTVDYPVSIGKMHGTLYSPDERREWLSRAIGKAHREKQKRNIGIDTIVFKTCTHVTILNTLDSLYGHVLLKLYNAFYHLDKEKETGLILIIPRMFLWLVPAGCAEVWVVDLKLSELVYSYEAIEKFVSDQFSRFEEIYLSKAYSHPDISAVNIARMTGVDAFNLKHFSTLVPTVTFVLREDRWWFGHPADYWIYRACRSLNLLSQGSRWLSRRQNRLVARTCRSIKERIPDARIYITGLGRTGDFGAYASDERQRKITDEVERTWCKIYAQSHVVIGVHGSNMLLPTAHAAGCVEVLPLDRYGNMVQDISVRYNNRLQLFFYRFVDQFAAPRSVAEKAVAMIRDYEFYHRNMSKNIHADHVPAAGHAVCE
jgi:hypothetical protein